MARKKGKNARQEREGSAPADSARRGAQTEARDRKRSEGGGFAISLRRWPLMIAITSVAAVLLGATMIALNLLSVTESIRVVNAPDPASVPGLAQPATGAPEPAASNPGAPAQPIPTGLERRSKGKADAPVVITEWFDYLCGGCARFALTTESQIEKSYISTGKVRFVPRNFPFLAPESLLAAEAAEAAADQGRYWAYRTLLLQRLVGGTQDPYQPEKLKRYAAELGLDQKAFDHALDQRVHREAILAEKQEGIALEIKATPSIFINGRLIPGVPTVERLGQLIEEELAIKR